MLSALYYRALQLSGITALVRSARAGGTIFCYHNVVADGEEGGDPAIHIAASAFTRQAAWIRAQYDVLPLGEMVARLEGARPLRRTASITFDDAYTGVFTHALPLLRSLALPATVFVPTACVDRGAPFWWDHPAVVTSITAARRERWLGELQGDADRILEQVAATLPTPLANVRLASQPLSHLPLSHLPLSHLPLSQLPPSLLPPSHRPASWSAIAAAARDGWALGAHSATHRALPQLNDAELEAEVNGSRAALEQRTGVRAEHFAYPYGLWSARVADRLRGAGFSAAVTLDAGFNVRGLDPMALRRINIPASIADAAFAAWAAGLRPSRLRS